MGRSAALSAALTLRLAAGLAAGLLAGCSGQSDAELQAQALAQADAALARHDAAAAIVTLKDFLERQPDSAPVRLALGRALLAKGEAAAAEIELAKAEQRGADANRVVPQRARALLAAAELDSLLGRYQGSTLTDPQADADLKVTLAIAAAARGQPERAEHLLAQAERQGPAGARAGLLRARLELAAGRPEAALTRLAAATGSASGSEAADLWLLRGEIQQTRLRQTQAALDSFGQAVQQDPGHPGARRALALLLLATGDRAGAQAQVDALQRTPGGAPGAKVLRAMLDFERQDFAAARQQLQPLLAAAPTSAVLLELAGATELRLGALEQAETLLKNALERNPQATLARTSLAQIYQQRGQAELVLQTLAPLLQDPAAPPALRAMAAQAHLLLGQTAQAHKLLAGTGQGSPREPASEEGRVRQALLQLGSGDKPAALAQLQALARSSTGTTADAALIGHYMRQSDWPRALQAIDALQRKQPDRPAAELLRGRVLAARQDFAGARTSYEAALARAPGLLPALQGLAALDIAQGKPEQARQRLAARVAASPADASVQLALTEVLERSGSAPEDVLAQLRQAVAASPASAALRLRLVNTLLLSGQAAAARTAAAEAVAALPGNAELLHAAGRAALAGGDHEQAARTFAELAQRLPRSAQLQLDLASARSGQGDWAAAERHLRQALDIAPQMTLAQEALLASLLRSGRREAALAFARELQKRQAGSAIGHFFEGDIELRQRRFEPALAAYRRALQLEPSARAAQHLHAALLLAGRSEEAARHARAWVGAHPEQLDFAVYLADQQAQQGDRAGAEAAYRELLRRQPAHVPALNNLAWLLAVQGKSGALELAERARAAAPFNAQVQDTLALALEVQGQVGRAAELQAQLVQRHPGNADFRLRWAQLLVKTGDKAKARAELDRLALLGQAYARQAEVKALRDGL